MNTVIFTPIQHWPISNKFVSMRIHELILETADLAGLRTFYEKILGLPVEGSDERIAITIGTSLLVFNSTNLGQPFYHFAFTIPANSIASAKVWLERKVPLIWISDYNSEIADFVNWHAKSIYFFDTAGNIVELIARFDLDNATDGPFSSSQMLSISEVGVVFGENELEERTKEILQQHQLSYFDKQSPLPQFKAVGDDEGLFIIVPANRNWYPTAKASGIFPEEVRFDSGGKIYTACFKTAEQTNKE
jgi:catechol 2,3-dioxygenase-like lactoylglutathione lyase family enzyme